MTFEAHFAAARAAGADSEMLGELARLALAEGEEERALDLIAPIAARAGNASLWQWTGLLHRALDSHESALAAFTAAAALDPDDAGIAHGHARVALEAGLDAVLLFERAVALAPDRGDRLVGLAAARFSAGGGARAEGELDRVLARHPGWVEGHVQLGQLRTLMGRPQESTRSFERALQAYPFDPELWRALFDVRVRSEDFQTLATDLARAERAGQSAGQWRVYAAIAAAETGDTGRADSLFDGALNGERTTLAIWEIRHLLRTGRFSSAVRLIEAELATERAPGVWPYASLAWRLTTDPRSDWLEGDRAMVAVLDLRNRLPPLDVLAAKLRTLHVATGSYMDQSVRGGTQTDGPMFSRIDPMIRTARAAVVRAVDDYLTQLPASDAAHPLLAPRRDRRVRFAGSWSVRLQDAGFHENHVHPQGWISSALYVALPAPSADQAGWLKLGEPQAAIGVGAPATRTIEPREGQLVLFPSWMWHGTIPFASGERLTLAFDVALPK